MKRKRLATIFYTQSNKIFIIKKKKERMNALSGGKTIAIIIGIQQIEAKLKLLCFFCC